MVVRSEAHFFAGYWTEFGPVSRYQVYFEGDGLENFLVKMRSGNRVVGACLRKGRGALVAVPSIELDNDDFLEEREEDGDVETYWSKKGIAFGRRLAGCLVAMAEALASESAITPPPNWASSDIYRLPEEVEIEQTIGEITAQVASLDNQRIELESKRTRAGILRNLLFEQGKPLEDAVLEALRMMGFEAKSFRDARL